jgi:hypothetical protein
MLHMTEVIDLEIPSDVELVDRNATRNITNTSDPCLLGNNDKDAYLALCLQAEENTNARGGPPCDGESALYFGQTMCAQFEYRKLLSDGNDEHKNRRESQELPSSEYEALRRHMGDKDGVNARGNEALKRNQPGGAAPQKRRHMGSATTVRVKLFIKDGKSLEISLPPTAVLSSVFSEPSVLICLKSTYSLDDSLSSEEVSNHFSLRRCLPQPKSFDRALFRCTSVVSAVGRDGGVLHAYLHPSVAPIKSAMVDQSAYSHGYDGVKVLRLHRAHTDFGSPIVLVKNLNRDRGALLARITELRGMVEESPDAKKELTMNVRSELDGYPQATLATREVQKASDRVLDICEQGVSNSAKAKAALNRRTVYGSTAVLLYPKGASLPRHVDNCGNWVVLFSFGNTVDFFCGEEAVQFESGDALVFNGSKEHAVMHGIDKLYPYATLGGKRKKLSEELSYLHDVRASFQARQTDG